jgi:hypothetical protein
MADRGTATFIPSTAFSVATDYDPIVRGSGGTPVDPKRYLLTGAGWVPIQ